MKKHQRILSLLMALWMIAGTLAIGLTVGAEEPAVVVKVGGEVQTLPYVMKAGTEAEINGIKIRFDNSYKHTDATPYGSGTNRDMSVTINADGSITGRMANGDMLWFPDLTVDEQSIISYDAVMDYHNAGGPGGVRTYDNVHELGLAFNIRNQAGGNWASEATESTAKTNIAGFRSSYSSDSTDLYYSIGKDITPKNIKDAWEYGDAVEALVDVSVSKSASFGNRIDMNEPFGAVVKMDEGALASALYDGNGKQVALALYDGEDAATLLSGAIGFTIMMGMWDSSYQYTISNFTVKNALVGGTRKDVTFNGNGEVHPLDRAPLMVSGTPVFDETEADVTFLLRTASTVPATATVVVKHNDTEIYSGVLSDLTKEGEKYKLEKEISVVDGNDVVTFALFDGETPIDGGTAEYNIGAAYTAYDATLNAKTDKANLNAVLYYENFDNIPDMVLDPGENVVGDHVWYYVANSDDGYAKIINGQLDFYGSQYDMILFDIDTKRPYIMTADIQYQSLETTENVAGFVQHVHTKNDGYYATIAAVTDSNLYLENLNLKNDYSFKSRGAVNGSVTLGTTAANRNASQWSQYFNTTPQFNTFTFNTYSGVNGYANGELTSRASLGGVWGDFYGLERSGRMGLILGANASHAIFDEITLTAQGKAVTVDGEQKYFTAGSEISVKDDLSAEGKKIVFAEVDGETKLAGDTIVVKGISAITTTQIAIETKKLSAVGTTGLKFKTVVDTTDLAALQANAKVATVEAGTVVIPTKSGTPNATAENAQILPATLDETTGVFESVLDIAKADRGTSYSGVGFLKITLTDSTVIVVSADYKTRLHAYALTDFVEDFGDTQETETKASGKTEETSAKKQQEKNTEKATEPAGTTEKMGCGSTVGTGAVAAIVAVVSLGCVKFGKKKED